MTSLCKTVAALTCKIAPFHYRMFYFTYSHFAWRNSASNRISCWICRDKWMKMLKMWLKQLEWLCGVKSIKCFYFIVYTQNVILWYPKWYKCVNIWKVFCHIWLIIVLYFAFCRLWTWIPICHCSLNPILLVCIRMIN